MKKQLDGNNNKNNMWFGCVDCGYTPEGDKQGYWLMFPCKTKCSVCGKSDMRLNFEPYSELDKNKEK